VLTSPPRRCGASGKVLHGGFEVARTEGGMAVAPWETVLGIGLALVLLVFWGPKMMRAAREAPRAGWNEWRDVVIVLGLVVLFVALLVKLA